MWGRGPGCLADRQAQALLQLPWSLGTHLQTSLSPGTWRHNCKTRELLPREGPPHGSCRSGCSTFPRTSRVWRREKHIPGRRAAWPQTPQPDGAPGPLLGQHSKLMCLRKPNLQGSKNKVSPLRDEEPGENCTPRREDFITPTAIRCTLVPETLLFLIKWGVARGEQLEPAQQGSREGLTFPVHRARACARLLVCMCAHVSCVQGRVPSPRLHIPKLSRELKKMRSGAHG